ncbi:putative aldehyde reductase [Thozetella sp. PMI_491]|nr:putative aldehyde reductase [Thozetella sp. PMI_491]
MAAEPVNIIWGGTRVGNRSPYTFDSGLEEALNILEAHRVKRIDSAQSYGSSQAAIGEYEIGRRFIIDTKWGPPELGSAAPPGGLPTGWASKAHIVNSAKDSIKKLGVRQVGIFYLHKPDHATPISGTLSGVNEVYQLGLFRQFGLSNFKAPDVQAVFDHCAEKGYVLPTVYQGSYSPITRGKETDLLPTLRKLGIAFYAFSPSAGGFLGKTVEQIEEQALNAPASLSFRLRYAENPRFMEALAMWGAIAKEEGVSRAELAYRWVAYHSVMKRQYDDALIFNASSLEQLEETLGGIEKGPLSEKACAGVDAVWEIVKD